LDETVNIGALEGHARGEVALSIITECQNETTPRDRNWKNKSKRIQVCRVVGFGLRKVVIAALVLEVKIRETE
jgi:hypothetical protein